MTAAQQLKKTSPVTGKINRLHRLLVKETSDFEHVAGNISDNALRLTVLSLAQQNNQYAAELSSYLQCTGATAHLTSKVLNKHANTQKNKTNFSGEKQVLAFCSSNEKKLVAAYRRILHETLVYEGLQKMMDSQLNGILSACTQLKLLSSLKRTYHS